MGPSPSKLKKSDFPQPLGGQAFRRATFLLSLRYSWREHYKPFKRRGVRRRDIASATTPTRVCTTMPYPSLNLLDGASRTPHVKKKPIEIVLSKALRSTFFTPSCGCHSGERLASSSRADMFWKSIGNTESTPPEYELCAI